MGDVDVDTEWIWGGYLSMCVMESLLSKRKCGEMDADGAGGVSCSRG